MIRFQVCLLKSQGYLLYVACLAGEMSGGGAGWKSSDGRGGRRGDVSVGPGTAVPLRSIRRSQDATTRRSFVWQFAVEAENVLLTAQWIPDWVVVHDEVFCQ